MTQTARRWRVMVGGLAIGVAGVVGFADASASAAPVVPAPPSPAPAPAPAVVPQTGAATPGAVGGRSVTAPSAVSYPAGSATVPATPMPSGPPMAAGSSRASATPPQPTLVPASSGTLRDYLQGKGVKLEPQKAQGFNALDITLPMPLGWTQVPDPNVPDAFVVTANRNGNSIYTSNAQVVVYKLVGNFDPREAITHGFVNSQKLLAWQTTSGSLADFCGFPSSIIEGTYRQNDMTLNTSRRYVIVTSGPDEYLVSLAVTTDAAQAVADAPATDSIINGFRVTAPTPGTAHGRAPAGLPQPPGPMAPPPN